jgi:ATP adenylyltransferase/5',5'''-P-1,P-4-tetraphosphate phosphorylase II
VRESSWRIIDPLSQAGKFEISNHNPTGQAGSTLPEGHEELEEIQETGQLLIILGGFFLRGKYSL